MYRGNLDKPLPSGEGKEGGEGKGQDKEGGGLLQGPGGEQGVDGTKFY